MKKIILGVALALLFVGCSSKSEENVAVEPLLVVGKEMSNLALNDQFEKAHTLNAETTKIVFALSKESAHICNDFFATQTPSYLSENKTQFVADVSSAPSLIRSMFIMPGLKDFKHTVLILDDKEVAAPYRSGVDVEKIIVAFIEDGKIASLKMISTEAELKETIENTEHIEAN